MDDVKGCPYQASTISNPESSLSPYDDLLLAKVNKLDLMERQKNTPPIKISIISI